MALTLVRGTAEDTRCEKDPSGSGDRRFARFWVTQLFGQVGAKTALVMLPMIAVVLYHAGSAATGLIVALQYLPVIAVASLAGGVLDRWDRRLCLTFSYAVTGGALLLVPAFAHSSVRTIVLLAVCGVVGAVMTFADLCAQTVPPDLVPPSRLVAANGRLEFVFSICLVGGPGIAGVMVGRLGGSTGLAVNTALCLLACLVAASLKLPRRVAVAREDRGRRTTLLGTVGGLRLLLGDRVLRLISVQAALFNLLEQVFLTLYLLFAVREWGFSASLLGLTMSVGGVGTILASLVVSRFRGGLKAGRAIRAGMGLACLAPLLVPAVTGAMWVRAAGAIAAFLLYGFGMTLYNIHAISLRQTLTPADKLGVVSAAYRLLAFTPIGVGALLGGWAGSLLGLRTAIVVSTLLLAASFVVFTLRLRHIRVPLEEAFTGAAAADDTHDSDEPDDDIAGTVTTAPAPQAIAA